MDMYKQFSMQVTPVIVLNFQVEDDFYDINVSPDKREVFLKNEQEIIKELKQRLNDFFDCIQKSKLVQNLKKKEDGYNPQLDEEENMIVKSLQKKKVMHKEDHMSQGEEEDFKRRKESGVQKSMSEYSQKFSQYKDSLRKRKVKQYQTEEKEIQDKFENGDEMDIDHEEVPKVKRLKTEFECENEGESGGEEESGSNDKNHTSSNNSQESEKSKSESDKKVLPSYTQRRREKTMTLEERSKNLKRIDPFARQQKQKDFLSKFKAASKRINKKKEVKEDIEKPKQAEEPEDYMSAISRTFGPTKVKYTDKENDPTYEMNQELLKHHDELNSAHKKPKMEILKEDKAYFESLMNIPPDHSDKVDITKQPKNPENMVSDHPMNIDKSVFMEKLPVTTGFDTEDVEVSLDISKLPGIIERETLRYAEIEEKKDNNILSKIKQKKSDKNNIYDTGDIDKNIIDIDESKLDEMFGKEDFRKLKIIGQFNLGFILAVREDTNQLFIMDQHATDEKCTFERLSQSTVIHSQPLMK